MKKKFVYSLFFVLFLGTTFAQNKSTGFELNIKLNHYPDSLQNALYLGRYYGGSQYFTDTFTYNPKTKIYSVKNKEQKEGGLYLLITEDKRFAEIIIDKDQNFSIETSYPNMTEAILFKNSPENKLYQDFAEAGRANYIYMDSLQKLYKTAKESQDEARIKELEPLLRTSYQIMEDQKENFIHSHPENLMAVIFKAQKDIDVPQAPENIADSLKNEWRYQYYKNHYFDHINLCDDRILRTPLFQQRLDNYINNVLSQHPDSLKYGIDRVIEKTRCNKELFKYMILYPLDKYQRSEIIGHDAIWVYLADKYYLGGDAYWASESIVENFRKRIDRVKPLLIGSKPVEFMCPDTSVGSKKENWVSVFSSPKKYTVVVFWEMSCGHCKKSLPKLLDVYHKYRDSLSIEVIAINQDGETEDWKKYIREQGYDWINLCGKTANLKYNEHWDITSTPTIYVLDRDKRIVTKRIDPEHIEPFIRIWEEQYYKPKK